MGRYAGRSCTTCEEKSERAPVSGRSAKPLPQLPSPLTAKSQPKRPKRPKADRDLWVFERQAFGLGYATVAGVDEAGPGARAGAGGARGAATRPPIVPRGHVAPTPPAGRARAPPYTPGPEPPR